MVKYQLVLRHYPMRAGQSLLQHAKSVARQIRLTTMKVSASLTLVCILIVSADSFEQRKCLPGDNHKDYSSPETSLLGCEVFKENSCCTSNFTQELATSPIRKIGNFSWTQCNNTLSPRCEAFMVDIECFYRCSHNAIFWENPKYPSAILEAPVCASFCDAWFDACKNDLTCAKNWLTDFNTSANGENLCKMPCRNFSDYFTDGKDLCESMWGTSFVYKETDCLEFNLTLPNPNDDLVEKLFGTTTTGTTTTTSTISGAFSCTITVSLTVVNFIAFLVLQN